MGIEFAFEYMPSDVLGLFHTSPQLFFFQWGFDIFWVTNKDALGQLVARTNEIIQGFYLLEI